jgi:hypothetical protein
VRWRSLRGLPFDDCLRPDDVVTESQPAALNLQAELLQDGRNTRVLLTHVGGHQHLASVAVTGGEYCDEMATINAH